MLGEALREMLPAVCAQSILKCNWKGLEQYIKVMTSLNAQATGQAPELSSFALFCVTLYECCSEDPTIGCAQLAFGSMASLTELSINDICPAGIDSPGRSRLHIAGQPIDLAKCAPFGTPDAY